MNSVIATAAATILGGTLLLVLGDLIKQIFLKPFFDFKTTVRDIDIDTAYYARFISNPSKFESLPEFARELREKAADRLRFLACDLYGKLNDRYFVGKKKYENILEARNLLIRLSNSLFGEDPKRNSEDLDKVRNLLNLPPITPLKQDD